VKRWRGNSAEKIQCRKRAQKFCGKNSAWKDDAKILQKNFSGKNGTKIPRKKISTWKKGAEILQRIST
jgi:hypothetical protein